MLYFFPVLICFTGKIWADPSVSVTEIVNYAKQYTGKIPYVWGGGSTNVDVSQLMSGTDCSGFVCGVFYHFGINLWPYKGAIRNSPKVYSVGSSLADAEPGDIIHWPETVDGSGNGHVAIYAGDGWMVHETTGSYNGVSSNVLYTPVSLVAANRPISGIYRAYDVSSDIESPVISNARITEISKDGYTVVCDVNDNVGVTRVTFPTWTDTDWQDDIVWQDGTVTNIMPVWKWLELQRKMARMLTPIVGDISVMLIKNSSFTEPMMHII